MFLLGGDLNGGKVRGKWPGLERGELYEGRDLALTTDFRSVLSELLARNMGGSNLDVVFPNFDSSPRRFLGLLKA